MSRTITTIKCLGLLLISCVSLQATGAPYKPFKAKHLKEPSPAKERTGKATRADAAETVVFEDFSKFVNGSEEAPVPVQMNGYYIPDNLTAQPGWVGRGIYEAGKACAIMYYNSDYYGKTEGYLDTPEMYLYGTVTLSFRAKVLNGTKGSIWVPLCDTYDGPVDSETFTLTDNWETYTYTSTSATSYDNYYQFTPENCEVLIDEVIVEVSHDKVKAPYPLLPDNLSLTSFRAKWGSEISPDNFLLNVYSKEAPEIVNTGYETADFNDVNTVGTSDNIDSSNPNYPAGWNINSRQVAIGSDNSTAILLNREGQYIESPEMPLPVKELSFWIRPTNMLSESYEISLLQVSVYSGEWTAIANLPNYWLESNGGIYSFEPAAIGEGVTKIRLSYLQEGSASVGFAIDDITVTYETPELKVPFLTALELPGNQTDYVVENIDPEKNYYYTVNAVLNNVVSPDSYPQWVDGINGMVPVALPAENVTATGFTARWEGLPHADNYHVRVMKTTEAQSFLSDVTVLEEDFEKITTGTLADPGYDFISPFNFGANGMANSDWMATQPRWIEGMAGSDGTSWFGSAGIVASPYLSLTNDGGEFDVEFSALSIVENDEIFCIIIDNINSTQALESQSLQLGAATTLGTTKVHFGASETNRDNIMVAFMSKSGMRFFIDNVRISQNLQPGEALSSIYATSQVEGTSCEFTGLSSDSDYSYSVVARAYKDFEDYESKRSNEIEVKLSAGVEKILDSMSFRYNYNGNELRIWGAVPGQRISLYNLMGQKVSSGVADFKGEFKACCPAGIYILRAGNKSMKIYLK